MNGVFLLCGYFIIMNSSSSLSFPGPDALVGEEALDLDFELLPLLDQEGHTAHLLYGIVPKECLGLLVGHSSLGYYFAIWGQDSCVG